MQILRLLFAFLILTGLFSFIYLWFLHMDFISKEKESPLDYLKSNILKPFYNWQCPVAGDNSTCSLPKIFMISARSKEEKKYSKDSWKNQNINLIDTQEISSLMTDHFVCKEASWSNRLFSIYQRVFREILNNYAGDDDFIFVEDDVVLLDFKEFKAETCMARKGKLHFYSFYKPSSQVSCLYHHGTPCYYINRQFMEHLAKSVAMEDLCRLPIDLYIASSGPWYSTTKSIIKHTGTRLSSIGT